MKKLFNNITAIFIIGIIFLIIIPLPPMMLDVMIIINITVSLGILLLTMYIRETLEFSVFPSLLLIMTLFRISLNISSTRLILGNGGEAGQVIKTFGQFVISGNAIVGFIIFIIIVIVQFIVITKGSERVAEVAARFTLDAMPGKQMAIDADLNAGLIDDATARLRRSNIQREADFYGAMDGASKFVKGDAIVAIIVMVVNIIGGVIIGMVNGGKSFADVLNIYTIATVGDGLVSQLPALMVSTATGMVVTRSSSENNLAADLPKQILSYPITMIITGCVLMLMCLIPGFPVFQLVLVGGFLVFMGSKMMKKKESAVAVIADDDLPMSETEFYKDPQNIYSLINVELLEMEFGYSLIPLVDEKKGGSFIDRVVMLRRQFAAEMGMVIPSVRLRDNIELNPNQYIIKLKGEEIARGEVLVDHFLAMNPGGADDVEGIDTVEPAFGIPAKWVTAEMRETAQMSGYTIIDPLSVIVTHLSEAIKRHAYELLGQREVNGLLDNLKKTNKTIVEDLIPSVLSVSDLQKILSNLLMEQIPIRDLTTVLETAGEFAPTVKDMDLLTEYVRQSLKRTITRKFAEDGSIKVITLNPELENIILNSVKKTDHGSYVSIDPDIVQKMIASHLKEIGRIKDIVSNPVILTSPVVRVYYRKLIEQFIEDAIVLSFNEIEPSVRVQSLGTISIS